MIIDGMSLHLAIRHWQDEPSEVRYARALQEWVKYEEAQAKRIAALTICPDCEETMDMHNDGRCPQGA